MLRYDAGVLHRHQPTGERHDLGPKPRVFGVEWRSFFCGLTHARTLDFASTVRNARDRMNRFDKLERRLGFLAVPGLLRYVAALTALVFILYKLNPSFLTLIDLDPAAVRHGEIWRLFTYIFIPA